MLGIFQSTRLIEISYKNCVIATFLHLLQFLPSTLAIFTIISLLHKLLFMPSIPGILFTSRGSTAHTSSQHCFCYIIWIYSFSMTRLPHIAPINFLHNMNPFFLYDQTTSYRSYQFFNSVVAHIFSTYYFIWKTL